MNQHCMYKVAKPYQNLIKLSLIKFLLHSLDNIARWTKVAIVLLVELCVCLIAKLI